MEQLKTICLDQPIIGAAALIALQLTGWVVFYALRTDRWADKADSEAEDS